MEVEKLPPQSPATAAKRLAEVKKTHPEIGDIHSVPESDLPESVTKIKVLTQPANGGTHRASEITIDWSNVSPRDLYSLARNALVADAMARMVKNNEFPEKVMVRAKDHIHRESESVMKYTFTPKQVKLSKELESFLSGLSKEELVKLLG